MKKITIHMWAVAIKSVWPFEGSSTELCFPQWEVLLPSSVFLFNNYNFGKM